MQHVAIVNRGMIEPLLRGGKSVESRLSRTRRPPYGRIRAGDTVYFKAAGGPVFGRARVRGVEQFAGLTPPGVAELARRYGPRTCAPPGYWRRRRACRYATLIWLGPVRRTRSAPRVARQFGSAWIALPTAPGARDTA